MLFSSSLLNCLLSCYLHYYTITLLLLILLQYSTLNSNPQRPTKFVLIMRFSNYEFALNIKCKYNELIRDHNHMPELSELYYFMFLHTLQILSNLPIGQRAKNLMASGDGQVDIPEIQILFSQRRQVLSALKIESSVQ